VLHRSRRARRTSRRGHIHPRPRAQLAAHARRIIVGSVAAPRRSTCSRR
jgi:hypothetical protein